jgi:hypothetical protein
MWYGQDEDLYIYDILCEERTFFVICLFLKRNKHVMCTFIYINQLNIILTPITHILSSFSMIHTSLF